jgi:hypothetical protein
VAKNKSIKLKTSNNMEKQHALHAAAVGAVTFALTRSIPWTVGIGGGALAYMLKWGHGLPTTADEAPTIVLQGFQPRSYNTGDIRRRRM